MLGLRVRAQARVNCCTPRQLPRSDGGMRFHRTWVFGWRDVGCVKPYVCLAQCLFDVTPFELEWLPHELFGLVGGRRGIFEYRGKTLVSVDNLEQRGGMVRLLEGFGDYHRDALASVVDFVVLERRAVFGG